MTLNDPRWPRVCGADKIWIGWDRIGSGRTRSDHGSDIGPDHGSDQGPDQGPDHRSWIGSCNIKLEILCKIEHRPHWDFFFCPKTPCSHFHGSVEECCVVPPCTKASEKYASFHQSVKKNATQSSVASWGSWASFVADAWGTLEAIVRKLINLCAPHCKVKVLGVIRDAWLPTDPYNIQPKRGYFSDICFVTHSSQYHLRFAAVRDQWSC